jgi:hypothetical protein
MKTACFAIAICSIFLLYSCRGNNASASKDIYTLSDTTSVTGFTGDSVKLIKTASTRIKVENVEQSVRTVSALAQRLGGMLSMQELDMVEQDRKELLLSADSLLVITAIVPGADITARIPTQNLEAFLFGVADLGYFTNSSHLQVEDKSLLYFGNALKQKNRENALSNTTQKQKLSTTLQTIDVKDEAIEQQMANAAINADVKYSTVNLSLFQNALVRKETVANTNLNHYELSFWKRFGNALENSWDYFLNFVLVIVNLWIFIFLGVITFVLCKYGLRRKLANVYKSEQHLKV